LEKRSGDRRKNLIEKKSFQRGMEGEGSPLKEAPKPLLFEKKEGGPTV